MKTSTVAAIAASATLATAQRPSNVSMCDYYSNALLKTSNATTQQTLVTLLVNTAIIGNYTQPNVGVSVPGILAPGNVNGTAVNLLPYFDGSLASSNNGGSMGVAVNWLDGGAAAPLKMNMAANDTSSNQYMFLSHLYQYIGVLLGCSEFGSKVMPYAGSTSMYQVHKFMDLNEAEFYYFVEQVGLSAASFGVSKDDVMAAGMALNSAFGYKCAPAAAIPPTAQPELQAICIAESCPTSPNATCASYQNVMMPMNATSPATASYYAPTGTVMPSGSMSGSSGSMSSSGSMASGSITPSTGGQGNLLPAVGGIFGAVAAIAAYIL